MGDRMEGCFPWLSVIQRFFLYSLGGDYTIEALDCLQRNVDKEIQKVQSKSDLERAKLLVKCIEYFYQHFCRIWGFQNKVPTYLASMKSAWVHILTSYIKISLFLSRGKKTSKWIRRVLGAITKFPGEKTLLYDALLSVHRLNNKYKPAYASILRCLFMNMPLFVPVVIDDPAEFLKACLLVRRLKSGVKDQAEKNELQIKTSKILAPPSLWDWLLEHDFSVPWTRKGIKKVSLRINICRKLALCQSQMEIAMALRKILLPGLCTEQRPLVGSSSKTRNFVSVTCADQVPSEDEEIIAVKSKNKSKKRRICMPFTDQFISRDDKEDIMVNENQLKRKKFKKRKSKSQEYEMDINVRKLGMQKPIEKLEDVVGAEENVFSAVNRTLAISTFDNNKLVTNSQNKKKKSVHCEENLQYETGHADLPSHEYNSQSAKLVTEKIKKQRKQKLGKIAKKLLNKVSTSINEDSCLLNDSTEDVEQSADESKLTKMVKSKKEQDFMGNNDSDGKHKSKKRRQREKIVAEETPENMNVTPCDRIDGKTKSRRKKQKEKKSDSESYTENLPVIVDEIKVPKPDLNDREDLSITSIVDYDLRCSDLNSPIRKKNSDTETELKLKPEADSKIMAESIFIIDSEPSPCINEDSCLLNDSTEDVEQSADESKLTKMVKSKKEQDFMGNNDSDGKHKSKKRRQREKIVAEETPENMNVTPCDRIDGKTKSRRKKQKEKKSDSESYTENLPVIVDEIKVPKPNLNDREDLSITSIVDYDLRCSDLNSPIRKKNSDTETELKLKPEADLKIMAESIFIIDSEPSPCINEAVAGEIETQKNDCPSIETAELISGTNKVDASETNHISSERSENNTKVIARSDPPIESNAFSCVVKKREITNGKVSESTIDSPLSNTCLQMNEISSQSVAETEDSESVNISSPEKKNLGKLENEYSIELQNEAPLENSVSSLLENKNYLQLVPINAINSSQENVINERLITSDSRLPNETKSGVDSDPDSSSSFEIDNLEIRKQRDTTSIHTQISSQNNCIHHQLMYEVQGLFFGVSPGTEVDLSERSPNHHLDNGAESSKVETPNTFTTNVMFGNMFLIAEPIGCHNESIRQNMNEGDLTSTLNSCPSVKNSPKLTSSAANEKSAERLSFLNISAENVNLSQSSAFCSPVILNSFEYRDLPSDEDDDRSENTLSENKSILKTDVSEYPSDSSNDAGSELSDSSQDCNSLEASNFKNNCETYVVKNEWSWDDAITRQRFCDGAEAHYTSPQEKPRRNSTKTLPRKGWKLNPVVDLGEKCDSKSFIDRNSNASEDSLSGPTNTSVLPDIKAENETRSSESDQLLTQVTETAIKLEATEQSISNSAEHSEIGKVTSDVKIEIQPEHKNEKELCVTADQDLEVSGEDSELVELTVKKDPEATIRDQDQESVKVTWKKELSEDKEPELTEERPVKTEKSMPSSEGSSVLNHDIPTTQSMNLRNRIPSTSSTQGKSSPVDEGSSIVSQDTPETQCKNLRIRNLSSSSQGKSEHVTEVPSVVEQDTLATRCMTLRTINSSSSSQGSSEPVTEVPSVVEQDTLATRCMTLRSRNPSSSSSQGSSEPVTEVPSVVEQDTLATRCMTLRSRNPSSSSSQGKSEPVTEIPTVVNQDSPETQCMNLRSRNPSTSSSQEKCAPAEEVFSMSNQNTPATRGMKLRSRNPSLSSMQEAMKRKSETVTKRSSKRLKKPSDLNLGFDLSELSLNSPKAQKIKPHDSSNKNSLEDMEDVEPSTSFRGNSSRRLTRASVISSTVDTRIKEQETDPEGYNLRSRKPVIMPGKLKL